MKSTTVSAVLIVAIAVVAGCAKVQVTERETLVDRKLPRPDHIWIYDFVGTPGDVPHESSLASQSSVDTAAQTPEDAALNRQIGGEIAKTLAEQISVMGLPAEHASSQTVVGVGDLVIRGTLLRIVEGSAEERVAIGMGKGAAELKVAVEGFEMTPRGLLEIGKGTLDTEASKSPGAAVPAAVALATKNPLGLIVSTGVKLHGEETGSATIHGKVQQVAKQIATELRPRFEQQGWIAPQAN
jgi:hypothetical protein